MFPGAVKGQCMAGYASGMADVAGPLLPPTADRIDRRAAGAPASRRRWPARRWFDVVAMLALIVLAGLAVLPQVAAQSPLSALDEPSHFDYLWNVSNGTVPAAGDAIAPEVVEIWNCYGNELIPLPACGTTGPESAYPGAAQQYNFGHPPVYYVLTGIAARVVESVTGLDLLTAARALGAVWLGAGMVVMHLALRRFGLGVMLSVAVAAASGMWWPALSAATFVTNDAPFLLTTALGLLVAAGVQRAQPGWLTVTALIAVAALAAGVKVMNALPFLALAGACVVLALLPARYRPWSGRWSLLGAAAGMVGAVGAVYVLWTRFQGGRGDPDWVNPVEGVNTAEFRGAPFGEWLGTMMRGLEYVGHHQVGAGAADQSLITFTTDVLSVVAIAAIAIGIAVARKGSALAVLALAALIGSLAWPLVVQLQAFLSSGGTHYFMQPSYRYGVTMGVLAFACLALVAQRLRWQVITIIGCSLVVTTTLAALALTSVR